MNLATAFHWSRGAAVDRRTILIAAFGMAVPVGIGLAMGRAETGFTIGLGAMLLAGGPSEAPAGAGQAASVQDSPSPGSAALPALIAVIVASLIGGRGWPGDLAMILLAGAAATATNYSRPLAVAAIRFIIYLVLSVTLLENAAGHRGATALLFGLGALWNVAIRMALAGREPPAPAPVASAKPTRVPTPAQRRAHWRRTMRTLAGWQFPLRLAVGLAVAGAIHQAWPGRHYGWIVLTVALLTQRPLEHVPVKTIQRAIGASIGVALTWAILATIASPIVLALLICLFAAAAPIARAGSYLAYSAISTPAILLVMDLGRPIGTDLLVDRLVATFVGAGLVVALNVAMDRAMARAAAARH